MEENKKDEESIEINDLSELCDKRVAKRIGVNGKPKTLTNIRAIILHQDIEHNEDINTFIDKSKDINKSYHYFITQDGKIYQLNNINRAVPHCAFVKYSKFATNYFGDSVCPSYSEREKKHLESPNDCTVAICLPNCSDKNDINRDVMNSLVKLMAYIINKYSPSLQVQSNVFGLYKMVDKGIVENPKVFLKDENFLHRVRFMSEKLRSSWVSKYPDRGYPTEIINIMGEKEEDK